MKILRKFLVFILSLILSCVVLTLFIVSNIKAVFQDTIITTVVRETIVDEVSGYYNLNDEQSKKLRDVFESEEAKKVMSEFSEEFLITLAEENKDFDFSKIDDFLQYYVENKEAIEEATGITIEATDLESLKKTPEYITIEENINEIITEAESDEVTGEYKKALQVYNFLVSDSFKLQLICVAVGLLVLIALIQYSLINWLSILGGSLITSGTLMLLYAYCCNFILTEVLKDIEVPIEFDANSTYKSGICLIIFGIVCIVLKRVIKSLLKGEKDMGIESKSTNYSSSYQEDDSIENLIDKNEFKLVNDMKEEKIEEDTQEDTNEE